MDTTRDGTRQNGAAGAPEAESRLKTGLAPVEEREIEREREREIER